MTTHQATTKWAITGKSAHYDGLCIVCGESVNAKRSWEAILVQRREGSRTISAVAHAYCLGGKFGGVQGHWRGPSSIEV